MYVTRRLLRSTLEETTAVKPEPSTNAENAMVSPRKRRPLLHTQVRHSGDDDKSNNSSTPTRSSPHKSTPQGMSPKQADSHHDKRSKSAKRDVGALRGMGLLIDARDSRDRWCEAKILNLNVAEKTVFVHYVGWNTRYDCWLEAKFAAAHGSHTGVKPKAGTSWNGKDSLFSDPTIVDKPTKSTHKSSNSKTTKPVPTKSVVAPSSKKKKKRPMDTEANDDDDDHTNVSVRKASPTSKRAAPRPSSNRANVKIEVGIDAVDEDSEHKARRSSRREKVDLELEMDVRGDASPSVKKDTVGKPPAKRTRPSPTAKSLRPSAISTAKSPTSVRKPSPRGSVSAAVDQESKTDSEEIAEVPVLQSPTVGMSALRRSARAALVAKKSATKKRKPEDDDSDEEYKEEEDEEAEEEEEDDDEDEVDESDGELPVRRVSTSSSKVRRVSSASSVPRTGNAVITQWQTNPAYVATRDRLAMIFRHRLQQRGEFVGEFHGSFQQAMSGSSAASTPRSVVEESEEPKDEVKAPKKKKAKTAQPKMSDEEKAAAAQYYYAQHYYHMQAYQYHQYMYQQALVAQQIEQQQRLAESKSKADDSNEGKAEKDTEDNEGPQAEGPAPASAASPSSSPTTEAPVMNGGIIDPRFIHARMDALEHQKRLQLYYQHYNQATERNLQILAASPQYLQNGAAFWRDQVQSGHPLQGDQKQGNEASTANADGSDEQVEGKRPVDATAVPAEVETKHDESRQVENADQSKESQGLTPEATPEAEAPSDHGHDNASDSPRSLDSQDGAAAAQASPSEDQSTKPTSSTKTETVLFELVL